MDLPVVEMRSLEENRIVALQVDPLASPPTGVIISRLPPTLDAGWYQLRVSTSGSPSTSRLVRVACSVAITSVAGPAAPVALGQPAVFIVAAQGARRYQWQRCSTGACDQDVQWADIPGAASASYATPPVAGADAGTRYRAIVSGNCASATSVPVTLSIADANPPTASLVFPLGGEYWLLSTANNPPNSEVVTWSMSDDVRVCRVVVMLRYSDDGGATYSPVPAGGGVLGSFGPGGNCAFPGEGTTSLTYTVPTTFPSGHSGSLYKVQLVVTDQAGNATTPAVASPNPFYIVQANPDSVKTLILANVPRMVARQGISGADATLIDDKLHELANHPRVQGLVVDLSGVTSIQTLYAAWDADPSNADKANAVLFGAGGIHAYLRTSLLAAYSGVKYLVVVGDDRIIPMARLTDRTAILPESTYTGAGDLTASGTTVGQALAAGKYLSDDPLAVLDAVGTGDFNGNLFLPDLAVGRLVETPQEIVTAIATYIGQDGILDLSLLDANTGHKVLVTGYDFLSNVSTQMRARWKSTLGGTTPDASQAPVDGSLVGGNWALGSVSARTSALRTALSGNGGARYGVMGIAGHATHYEEGVPGTNPFDIQGLSSEDIYGADSCATPTLGALDLSGGVIYAVGCHGGLSVPGSCRTDDDHSLDLPQTMLSRGAVAYVANSGYGWGLKFGIGYGARLVQIFTEQMTTGGTIPVGDAVRQSKQRYYLETPRYDAYDEKSVMQWTLYGLPMYAVKTGIAPGASRMAPFSGIATHTLPDSGVATEEIVGAVRVRRELAAVDDAALRVNAQALGARPEALPTYLTQLSLSFDFTAAGVYTKHDSTGAELAEGPGCADANGCYYTLNGLVDRGTGSGDLPIQPYLIYDSRLAGTSQHGVLWKGGTYDEEAEWTPVVAELVSNGGDSSNHGAAPRMMKMRPTAPRVVPGVDSPTCRPSDLEVNSLTLTAGEAVKPEVGDPVYSIARRYRTMDLEVFYFNNRTTPTANCDRTGPELGAGPFSGNYHQASGATINFAVPATDAAEVWRVLIVYTTNAVNGEGRGSWAPLELTNNGSGTFGGSIPAGAGTRLTYVVEAVDGRGNVTWLDYVSAELPASGVSLGVARPVDVDVPNPALSINDVTVVEGNTGSVNAQFTVTLGGASSQTVTVDWATANGTATAGSDYTAASGTLTFAAGETTKTVTVAVLGDTVNEGNETYVVNLTNPANATPGDSQGTGTITNDDAPALTATPISATQINLSWTYAGTGNTGYKIERRLATSTTWSQIASTTTPTTTTYSSMSLTSCTGYVYRVRAYTGLTNGAYSNEAAATTLGCLATPTGLTATPISTTQINLAWTYSGTGHTGFKIERKLPTSASWTPIASTTTSATTTYSSMTLTGCTGYVYRVRAYAGTTTNGPYSNEAAATTLGCLPTPSSLVATPVSATQINLAWSFAGTGHAGFKIERKLPTATTWTQIAMTTTPATTTYSSTALTNCTNYVYRVRAYAGTTNNGPYSNEAAGATIGCLATPTSLLATPVSATQINLAWAFAGTGHAGFKIERKLSTATTWTQIASTTTPATTTYSSITLTGCTGYMYRVRAYAGTTNNGPYSNEVTATTTGCLAAPTALTATGASATQINLSWSYAGSGHTGYKIERRIKGNATWSQIASTTTPATMSYSNTALVVCTEYEYRVRAYAGTTNNGPYSTEATGATAGCITAPASLVATPLSATSIGLTWSYGGTGHTGYKIERRTATGTTWSQVAATTTPGTLTYTSSALTACTQYRYRVRAYTTTTANSLFSNEATATTTCP